MGHQNGVFSVAWADDNTTLATASADGTIKLWNTETMMETASLTGHSGKVRWVAWHMADNRLASAGQNGSDCYF